MATLVAPSLTSLYGRRWDPDRLATKLRGTVKIITRSLNDYDGC